MKSLEAVQAEVLLAAMLTSSGRSLAIELRLSENVELLFPSSYCQDIFGSIVSFGKC